MALFDFTSLFASENAARIVERKGRRILLCVAGDSLNEVRNNFFCNTSCSTTPSAILLAVLVC